MVSSLGLLSNSIPSKVTFSHAWLYWTPCYCRTVTGTPSTELPSLQSAVVALYRVQLQGSTPEYQVRGTATADKPMHTVVQHYSSTRCTGELEYYLYITSAQSTYSTRYCIHTHSVQVLRRR